MKHILEKHLRDIFSREDFLDKFIEEVNKQDKWLLIRNRIHGKKYFILDSIVWSYSNDADYWGSIYERYLDEDRINTKDNEKKWKEEFEQGIFGDIYYEQGRSISEWIDTLDNPYKSQLNYLFTEYLATQDDNTRRYLKALRKQYLIDIYDYLSIYESSQGEYYWRSYFQDYRTKDDCFRKWKQDKEEQERLRRLEEEMREIEKNKLHYSDSFSAMLQHLANNCIIADRLYNLNGRFTTKEFGDYITMRGDLATYLPNGREHLVTDEGKWRREGRQEIKIGKLANRLLNEEGLKNLAERDFEKFTNEVKSYISVIGDEDGNGKKIQFKVVKGNDIAYYYNENTYSRLLGKEHSLFNSCMRYENCEDYFNIYTYNEDVCSMLVAFDKNMEVLGRALLWVSVDNKKYMDTIYTHESLYQAFRNWAIENKYYYKKQQSCHHTYFDMYNGEIADTDYVSIQLKKHKFSFFPYLDTLKYLTNSGLLTNNEDSEYEYKLVSTDGDYERNDEYVYSEYHGEDIRRDDAIFIEYRRPNGGRISSWVMYEDATSDIDGEYYLTEDVEEVGGDYYFSDDVRLVNDINGDYQLEANCIYSDCEGEYIHMDDAVQMHDEDYTLSKYTFKCEWSGEIHHTDYMVTMEDGSKIFKEYEQNYIDEYLNKKENETINN